MAKLITDALKELYTAQGVTAEGDTIAEVLKDGNEKAYSATITGDLISDVISQTAETGTFSGGGSAPTVVNEITWDGTGDAVETDMGMLYKIGDNVLVLPYDIMIDNRAKAYNSGYSYDVEVSDGATNVPVDTIMLGNNGFMVGVNDNGGIICAMATVIEVMGSTLTLPSSGTYGVKIDGKWLTRITATPANGE